MSTALTPKQAALIAKGVYDVRVDNAWQIIQAGGTDTINNQLQISDLFSFSGEGSGRFKGTSGAVLRSESGFGYIAQGVGNRSDELLVATRGTVTGLDWLTDFAQSLDRGPTGYAVHAGFNRTFNSFKPTISEVITRGQKPSTVHVVGHSLGGALATIIADYLSEHGLSVKLYTFGCPRVGMEGFSRNLTRKLKPENMFRVHHESDLVSMVPIFPFAHTPIGRDEYSLPWGGMSSISIQAHFMGSYVKTIGDMSWDGLIRTPSQSGWEKVEDWLKEAAQTGGTCKMLSAGAMWMLMKAVDWILDKMGATIKVGAGLTALGAVTIMDRLAQVLYQGAVTSIKVSSYVGNLMIAILRFLGRAVSTTVNLTVQFITWVLNMFWSVISNLVLKALQQNK